MKRRFATKLCLGGDVFRALKRPATMRDRSATPAASRYSEGIRETLEQEIAKRWQ